LQRKADSLGLNTPHSQPSQDINIMSSGAFSYMSPSERVFLSDTTNQ
jgi:hypothetical protein